MLIKDTPFGNGLWHILNVSHCARDCFANGKLSSEQILEAFETIKNAAETLNALAMHYEVSEFRATASRYLQ